MVTETQGNIKHWKIHDNDNGIISHRFSKDNYHRFQDYKNVHPRILIFFILISDQISYYKTIHCLKIFDVSMLLSRNLTLYVG